MGTQEYDKAINGFKQLITRYRHFDLAYGKIVEAYRRNENLDQAEDYFHSLLNENPDNTYAYYGLGLVYHTRGDYRRAIEYFNDTIRRRLPSTEVFASLASAYHQLNDLDEAVRYLEALLKPHPDYVYAYYGLGYAYQLQKKYEDSLKYLNRALQLNADLVTAYMAKGGVYYDTNRLDEALTIYEQGLRAALRQKDLENQGKIFNTMGSIYNTRGNHTKAMEYHEHALRISREIGNRREEGIVLTNLGRLYLTRADYPRAGAYLHEALKTRQETGDPRGEGHCYHLLGIVYKQLGDNRKALECYYQAQSIYQEVGDRVPEGDVLTSLGTIHEDLGDYSKAHDYYQRALAAVREQNDPYRRATILNNLGNTYRNLGNHTQALEMQRQALNLYRQAGRRRSEGSVNNNIGLAYQARGRYAEALKYYQQALKISEETNDFLGKAGFLTNIGRVYTKLGDHHKALAYFQQSAAIGHKLSNPRTEGIALYNMGHTYFKIEDQEKAFDYFAQALKIGKEISNPGIVWPSCLGLAQTLEKQGNFNDAEDHYRQAVAVIENTRGWLATEEHRAGFLQDRLEAYDSLVNFLLKQHAQDPYEGYDREAFAYVERSRARALLDTLAEARVDVRFGISEPQKEREREIFREISRLQSDLQEAGAGERGRRLLVQLAEQEQRLEGFLLEIRRTNPRYAELHYPQPYGLEKVQRETLQAGEWLLEYALGQKKSYLFLISQDRFKVVPLPRRSMIEAAVRRYRRLLNQNPEGPEIAEAFHAANRQGRALYKMLLGRTGLVPGTKLIIVADGALHYLPFEALIEREVKEGETPSYLLNQHEIVYAPSASVFGWIRRETHGPRNQTERQLLAFGDPVLSRRAPGINRSPDKVPGPPRALDYNRADLPYARIEVKNIARLYPPDQSKVYLGRQATEAAFKREDLSKYRYIHLATHGRIEEEFAARSGILLGREAEEDGLLQMREIFNLDLNAELVVLSACETGLGRIVRGEGLLSLTRSFLYAGSRSLIVSLWEVRDETTAELMQRFYQDLQKGKGKSEALRRAKLGILQSRRLAWRHPYFWAPFVLVGNP